jgi:hypothetical protein
VNLELKFLHEAPTLTTHAEILNNNDMNEQGIIPLLIAGTTSYFPTRKPTVQEFESFESYPFHFELTYESPE